MPPVKMTRTTRAALYALAGYLILLLLLLVVRFIFFR